MSLRHKRNNSHLDSMKTNFQPVIGLLNTVATLNCNIEPQNHHFNIAFIHPLEIFYKLTKNSKKYAFDQIVATTFDIKIQQRTTFIPQALLAGDSYVIHQYKKIIQNSRISSYIKLNMRHQEKSYQKKPVSTDLRIKHKQTERQQSNIFSKVFNETTVNQRSTKKTLQYFSSNATKIHNQSKHNTTLTPDKQSRSFAVTRTEHSKVNEENFNFHMKVEQHSELHSINHTQTHNVKKSSSIKKSRGIDGIKINYIAIKGSHQNPQTSTFIYKSTTQKTNRQRSEFGNKTQFLSPHVIHFDKTLDNDISFSVNEQKNRFSVRSQFKQIEDNLSEQFQKSVKNSEVSQLTHNEMITNDYFESDRNILKKGRKSVFVENFERRENI